MRTRPDGTVATGIGAFLVIVGLIAGISAAGAQSLSGFWLGMAVANLGIGLGVLLMSLGYLVHAIWFLPGREIPAEDQAAAHEAADSYPCEWCGVRIRHPNQPCPMVDEARLRELAPQVANATCRLQLEERGYLGA